MFLALLGVTCSKVTFYCITALNSVIISQIQLCHCMHHNSSWKEKIHQTNSFFPSVVGLPDIDPITFLILSVYYKVWSLEMTVSVHTAKYCPLIPSSFIEFLLYKICSFNSFLLRFFLLNDLCNSMSHGSRARLRGLFCLSRVFRLPRVSRLSCRSICYPCVPLSLSGLWMYYQITNNSLHKYRIIRPPYLFISLCLWVIASIPLLLLHCIHYVSEGGFCGWKHTIQ